ncbi:MAG: regulatory protein RecX [Clostridia bacterium]|nr:regulatory protein RecX [Clostridia bacterium]
MSNVKRRKTDPASLSPEKQVEKAFSLSLYYLTRRERTEKQLRDYLEKKEYPGEAVDAVVERLKELEYLDDERFAQRYAEVRQRKGGRRKVRMELIRSGIDRDTAMDVVRELDEEAEIETAAAFARKALRGQKDEQSRKRAYASLQRRGYESGVIRQALRIAVSETEEETQDL